jgi:hypothetical protein
VSSWTPWYSTPAVLAGIGAPTALTDPLITTTLGVRRGMRSEYDDLPASGTMTPSASAAQIIGRAQTEPVDELGLGNGPWPTSQPRDARALGSLGAVPVNAGWVGARHHDRVLMRREARSPGVHVDSCWPVGPGAGLGRPPVREAAVTGRAGVRVVAIALAASAAVLGGYRPWAAGVVGRRAS